MCISLNSSWLSIFCLARFSSPSLVPWSPVEILCQPPQQYRVLPGLHILLHVVEKVQVVDGRGHPVLCASGNARSDQDKVGVVTTLLTRTTGAGIGVPEFIPIRPVQ